jgi:hypothetical protein
MDIMLAADTGGNYVAAAYFVFVVLLVIYLAIMANKLVKLQRRVGELRRRVEGDGERGSE